VDEEEVDGEVVEEEEVADEAELEDEGEVLTLETLVEDEAEDAEVEATEEVLLPVEVAEVLPAFTAAYAPTAMIIMITTTIPIMAARLRAKRIRDFLEYTKQARTACRF
jgi:hypothetical protein